MELTPNHLDEFEGAFCLTELQGTAEHKYHPRPQGAVRSNQSHRRARFRDAGPIDNCTSLNFVGVTLQSLNMHVICRAGTAK